MRLLAFLSAQLLSANAWFMSEKIPADISKNYFKSMQLRADQMFRDTIDEHRQGSTNF